MSWRRAVSPGRLPLPRKGGAEELPLQGVGHPALELLRGLAGVVDELAVHARRTEPGGPHAPQLRDGQEGGDHGVHHRVAAGQLSRRPPAPYTVDVRS